MKRIIRRALFVPRISAPAGMAPGAASEVAADDATSRRAFLQGTAGAAAGAAVVLATPKVASLATPSASATAEPKAVVTKPSGPAPAEPVTAYVRSAERHEVTVMSGRTETTYTDPALVRRLLDAAK